MVPTDAAAARGNLLERVAEVAQKCPRSFAILAPGRAPLCYGELSEFLLEVAGKLRGRGIGRGDRVASVLRNGPEMALCGLAVSGAAISAPLNPAYSAAEFEFYLADLTPRAVIVEADLDSPVVAVASERGIPVLRLRPDRGRPAGVFLLEGAGVVRGSLGDSGGGSGAALVLHTSGSTSRPKMVPLTHANLCASAANIAASMSLGPADRCLNIMPLFHIHGLVGAVLSTLFSGGSVVCTPGFEAPRFFEWLEEFSPSWYTAVPTMHQAILGRAERRRETIGRARLRFIRSCSSALAPALMRRLEEAFGVPVIEAYGMTEASHQMAINPLPPGARKPGSVGRASGCEVTILDAAGNQLPAGEVGEVSIRGANVTSGYANNPEANAASFTNGWFRTGDLGRLDGEGYLFLTGRAKEIINRGGEKISPREIDEALLDHPAVAQAMACALPDERLGEDVAAAVVLRDGAEAAEDDLLTFLAARLAPFKVPRKIVFLPELPRGLTGKPQRIGLAARLRLDAPAPAGREFRAPQTDLEIRLAALWSRLLGVERMGTEDNFFDHGGDSLLGAQLVIRVRDEFGVELPMFRLFHSPHLGEMAAWIATAPRLRGAAATPIARLPAGDPPPLSFSQHRMWFLNQFEDEAPAYHMPSAVRIRGPLREDCLRHALQSVVDRHAALRTTYPDDNGVPYQVVADSMKVAIPTADLASVPQAVREARFQELAREHTWRSYDLAVDGPLRAVLFRFGAEDHILLVVIHHIAADGWSRSIFFRELAEGYHTALAGRAGGLPELAVQYADFAAWQHRLMEGETGERLAEYWRQRLAGLTGAVELPGDRPRPVNRRSFRGGRLRAQLPRAVLEKLRALARAESATLFMTLLAAFKALLARYSGRTDLCVGSPIAGRLRRETEDLIGLFANVLALRTQLDGDPPFRELVARVRETTLGAYDHQEMPLERVLGIVQPERSLSYTPLFQVMFQLRNFPEIVVGLEGLECSIHEFDLGTSQFDLVLEAEETAEGLDFILTYCLDQFEPATAHRILSHYLTLVEGAAREPGLRLSRLPLLPAGERSLLDSWNRTAAPLPEATAVQLIEEQAARTPDAVAASCRGRSWTYRQLNDYAGAVAQRLTRGGALVPVLAERSLELLGELLGVWKAGRAYVPLDPAYPAERVEFIENDARAAEESVPPPSGSGPLAYVIYTSGSTGRPKGVAVGHRALVNLLRFFHDEIEFQSSDVLLAHTTAAFDISVLELFLPLVAGGRVEIVGRDVATDPRLLAAAIHESGATVVQATPATWQLLLESGWTPDPRLKLISGGEALPPATAAGLAPAAALWNGYGPTETTIYSTLARVIPGARITIGKPIANTTAHVLDAHRQPVPIGAPGELYIGGEGLAQGYWNQAGLTAERFVTEPGISAGRIYRTGDLVRRLPGGDLEYLGRLDHQIKLRGFRIEPGEIEAVLCSHSGVRAAAVRVVEWAPGDRRLAAWYVPRAAAPPEAELRALVERKLPPYMHPFVFVSLPALPLTPNGKVDRKALSLPATGSAAASGLHAPGTVPELAMVQIWEEVLGRRPVGLDDDFFQLGGHSLLGARLLVRVEQVFARRLPMVSLFLAPTAAKMLVLLEEGGAHLLPNRVVPLSHGNSGAPLILLGLQPTFRPLLLRFPPTQPLYALTQFDPARLQAPFQLEDIAAAQAAEVRNWRPEAPLALAGWCAEGVLAYEMAQQLRTAGREVAWLVMIDSFRPSAVNRPPWTLRRDRLQFHLSNLAKMDARQALSYGRERWETLARNLRSWNWRAEYERGLREGREIAPGNRVPEEIERVAVMQYRPRPYSGRVLLLRPRDRSAGSGGDSAVGWRELAANLRVVDIPGNHVTMFQEPNVAAMAEAVHAAIQR